MIKINAKQVLSNLYGLMMEINIHRTDEELISELREYPDPQVENHLLKIKQLKVKLRAEENRVRYQQAIDQIKILKQKGLEEIKKIFNTEEQVQLLPLFRKFEELTKEDEAAILEDQELLHFMEILKNRIDENPEQ